MDADAIERTIKQAVAAQYGLPESEVSLGLRFAERGDELDRLEILADVCDALDVFFSDAEGINCGTVADLIQLAIEHTKRDEESAG